MPTPYFCIVQESKSESAPASECGNVIKSLKVIKFCNIWRCSVPFLAGFISDRKKGYSWQNMVQSSIWVKIKTQWPTMENGKMVSVLYGQKCTTLYYLAYLPNLPAGVAGWSTLSPSSSSCVSLGGSDCNFVQERRVTSGPTFTYNEK